MNCSGYPSFYDTEYPCIMSPTEAWLEQVIEYDEYNEYSTLYSELGDI